MPPTAMTTAATAAMRVVPASDLRGGDALPDGQIVRDAMQWRDGVVTVLLCGGGGLMWRDGATPVEVDRAG
jgi:hypothetical protein